MLLCLSYFDVVHNNLSGKTPQRIAQFNILDENSYVGNPLLCELWTSSVTVSTQEPDKTSKPGLLVLSGSCVLTVTEEVHSPLKLIGEFLYCNV